MQRLSRALARFFGEHPYSGSNILTTTNANYPSQPHSKLASLMSANMAPATTTTDLTASSPVPSKPSSPLPRNHPAASPHPVSSSLPVTAPQPLMEKIVFPVQDQYYGSGNGFLHLPPNGILPSKIAAILLSGAGGGVTGPSGLYLSLAGKLPLLSTSPIPVLRLDYRYAARTAPCVADTKAAMTYLTEKHGIEKFVLVGWSFGGAPVYTLAGRDDRVIAAATVASQTADALKGAREAGRRGIPIMLLHGTGDRTLSDRCSRNLHEAWFEGFRGPQQDEEKATLVLFDGDDHALTKNAKKVDEMLAEFIVDVAGGSVDSAREVLDSEILGGKDERIDMMKKGGDLRGPEQVE